MGKKASYQKTHSYTGQQCFASTKRYNERITGSGFYFLTMNTVLELMNKTPAVGYILCVPLFGLIPIYEALASLNIKTCAKMY